jgi:hypothetical protein
MNAASPVPAAEVPLTVACLCAQWCRTCHGYRDVFEQVLRPLGEMGVQRMWVDVEDEADALGAVDVENFPTVLIARGDEVLFFGPVTPHAQTLQRLVHAALQDTLSLDRGALDAAVLDLPERLRALE